MSWIWYPFLKTTPYFWKKEEANITCCKLLLYLLRLPLTCSWFFVWIMMLLSLCKLSSTLQGWMTFVFVKRATLRSRIWSHCQRHRILVFLFWVFHPVRCCLNFFSTRCSEPAWLRISSANFIFWNRIFIVFAKYKKVLILCLEVFQTTKRTELAMCRLPDTPTEN